jgi:hypothetical protein
MAKDENCVVPDGVCKSCRLRPASGYVVRHGIYLANLCVKCWRKGETIDTNKRNYTTCGNGHHRGQP